MSVSYTGPIRKRKRKSEIIITPNIFLSENQILNDNDINNFITIGEGPINIRDIDRPFNIVLKGAHLKELLNSTPFEHQINTILVFKIQLYIGSEPFSKPYEIKWRNSTKMGKRISWSNMAMMFSTNALMLSRFRFASISLT